MNKIIKGKRYDTETAKEIFATPSYNDTGFEMYQKRTGEFFLYCWSKWEGTTPHIRPLTIEEAKEYAETHLTGDEYEEIFGTVEE